MSVFSRIKKILKNKKQEQEQEHELEDKTYIYNPIEFDVDHDFNTYMEEFNTSIRNNPSTSVSQNRTFERKFLTKDGEFIYTVSVTKKYIPKPQK